MTLTGHATNLDEAYQTLSTKPLMDQAEFDAFYRDAINKVRGGDKVSSIVRGLRRSYGSAFYKTFLMGHPGVGKSTEMTRLSFDIADRFRVVRFSAQTDLDAAGFKPFDVLLVIMIKLAEEMDKIGLQPSDDVVEDIDRWFATEKQTVITGSEKNASVAAGAKPTFAKLLGLFVEIKGEMKYTLGRKDEITEYRLKSIASLINLLNRLFDDCNIQLKNREQHEWLFIGEDFDKPGIPPPLTESLFINYANIFNDLRTHLIFSIPIALAYSDKATLLPLPQLCIPDTPVFQPDHSPHDEGRAALGEILKARMDPKLFEDEQMLRLIVASGGNLRDLFEMVANAADAAAIRANSNGKIGTQDATRAINAKRTEYLNRLGTSPYDAQPLTYDDKVKLLLDIYNLVPGYNVPNPVLHSLLRARAVQEFNGTRWFGVHPLVVDILKEHGKLKATKSNPIILGGTD